MISSYPLRLSFRYAYHDRSNDTHPIVFRLHLWLETDEGMFFGMGRAHLLAKIQEHGSLKKAADELGMSYRAAWGKIKKTEVVVGEKLVFRSGNKRDGYQLTELGKSLLEKFILWFDTIEKEAFKKAAEIFPWPVKSFKD